MRLFKITRGNATAYIVDNPSTRIDFEVEDIKTCSWDDIGLRDDLFSASLSLPGICDDFFFGCNSRITTHAEEAYKFVDWLRKNRDWDFQAEYIGPDLEKIRRDREEMAAKGYRVW